MIVTLPIMLILGIAIKLDSPGPIIFVQKRMGRDGEPFRRLQIPHDGHGCGREASRTCRH